MNDSVQSMRESLQQEWERQQSRLSVRGGDSNSPSASSAAATSRRTASAVDEMMDDLAQQIAVLESRLAVSNTVAQFLEDRAKAAQDERRANAVKMEQLAQQLQGLKSKQPSEHQQHKRHSGSSHDSTIVKSLESKLQRAMKQVEEKSNLIGDLERKCQEQKRQVESLQRQINETEEKLNTSYIATLDELTGQISELQNELRQSKEALKEAEDARILAEARAPQQQQQQQQAKSNVYIWDRTAMAEEDDAFQTKIKDLESKLALTTKVSEFLQQKLVTTENERDSRRAQVASLNSQLTKITEDYSERLRNADIKASDLDFKLHNTKRMLKFAENKAQKAEETASKSKTTMEHEIRDLRNKHITQQRMAKFMEGKCKTLLEDKKKVEAELGEKVFDLDFKLTGKSRVCKFLESSLEKAKKEANDMSIKMKQLQQGMAEKENKLGKMEHIFDIQSKVNAEQETSIKEMAPQLADLKSRLNVMNDVGSALQMQVRELEQERNQYRDKSQQLAVQMEALQAASEEKLKESEIKISDLDFKLIDAKRVLKSLLDKYNKAQSEHKQTLDKVSRENDNLRERLGKAKKVVDHLQDNIANSNQDQHKIEDEMGQKIYDLEFKLAESMRKSKFLETTAIRAKEEKTKIVQDMNSLKVQMEKAHKYATKMEDKYKAEVQALKARVSIADRVGEFVKQNKGMLGSGGGAGHSHSSPMPQEVSTTETESVPSSGDDAYSAADSWIACT